MPREFPDRTAGESLNKHGKGRNQRQILYRGTMIKVCERKGQGGCRHPKEHSASSLDYEGCIDEGWLVTSPMLDYIRSYS
jgi:hypothetical protein